MNQRQKDIDSQINYAVFKYGGNLPLSVARAKAENIANKAMLNYSPEKGNVKTYLSSHLQKLSRAAYKASTPVSIPESRLMSKGKIRNFQEEYHDTFGVAPSNQQVANGTGITTAEARLHSMEPNSYRAETAFENVAGQDYKDNHLVLDSLPSSINAIGQDIYAKDMKEKDIMKKYGLGRTTYFKKKKIIDNFLKGNSENSSITFN